MKSMMIFCLFCTFIIAADAIIFNSSRLEGKIANGINMPHKSTDFMVSIRINGTNFCGGALLTFRHVLSAGQCVSYIVRHGGYEYTYTSVVAGTNDLSYTNHKIYHIEDLEYHYEYDPHEPFFTSNYDVGVILLQNSVRVPGASKIPMGVFHPDLTRASISGWGSMEIMKEAVPFSQLHMSLLLNTIWVDIKHPDYCHNFLPCGNFQKYLLCAFGVKHDAKTSWGDAGSPVVQGSTIIGVTSSLLGVMDNAPMIFVNINAVSTYIEEAMDRLLNRVQRNNFSKLKTGGNQGFHNGDRNIPLNFITFI